MPLVEFFRRFFGLEGPENNHYSGFKKPIGIEENEDDDDDDDVIVLDQQYKRHIPFKFNVFSGNMDDIHRYLQQQMDEAMKTFDSPWFGNFEHGNFFSVTDNNTIDDVHPGIKDDQSPRNKFLKPSSRQKNDGGEQNKEFNSNDLQVPHNRNGGFSLFSGDALEIHKFFEQRFDDIMKKFSSAAWFSLDEGTNTELPDENPGRVETFVHPRNKFLKPSYEQPQDFKADSDIDNESYATKVFGKLLDKEPVQPSTSFVSRSVMTTHQRKMLPNGGIEERRKCVKNGQEELTVSRQLGDLKHVVTTVKLSDGTSTKNEEFINFDESELGAFNKSWNKM